MHWADLLNLWKKQLSQRLGRTEEDILEDSLLASDFPDSSLHIVFEDGSDLTFQRAFYMGDVDKRHADKSICRIAVFSENVGFHEFWIGPTDHIEVVMPKKHSSASIQAPSTPMDTSAAMVAGSKQEQYLLMECEASERLSALGATTPEMKDSPRRCEDAQ